MVDMAYPGGISLGEMVKTSVKKPLLASRKNCTGCMACVDACPHDALSAHIASDGHIYPLFHPERCIRCNRCTKTCPVINRYDHERKGCSQLYVAWANDANLRMHSSSGGVFAAVATEILKENGCVVGAVMDGFDVRHRLIEKLEELPLLQGSKYQQGDLTGIYRKVEVCLKQGRKVLFSGTGCQVGALYTYLGRKIDYTGLLFTTDLICAGFPSVFPLRCFLKNEPYTIKSLTYRDKSDGWYNDKQKRISSQNISILTETNQRIKYSGDLIYTVFSSHLLNRTSCLNCRFAKAYRRSDLTLADFWGDKDYPEEHYKGLSAVVVHSPEGERLLSESNVTFHRTSWNKFLPYNHRMVNGRFRFLNLHPGRIFAPFFFSHCSYGVLKQLYAVVPVTWRWFPYRVWHGVIMRLSKIGSRRKVKKALENMEA